MKAYFCFLVEAPAGREDSFLLFARGYPRVSTSHHTQGRSNHYHITRVLVWARVIQSFENTCSPGVCQIDHQRYRLGDYDTAIGLWATSHDPISLDLNQHGENECCCLLVSSFWRFCASRPRSDLLSRSFRMQAFLLF